MTIDMICLGLETPTECILQFPINCIEQNGNYWVTLLLWADWEVKPHGESPLHLIEILVEELQELLKSSAVIHTDSQITGTQMKTIQQRSVALKETFTPVSVLNYLLK